MNRRQALAVFGAAIVATRAAAGEARPLVEIWKSPTCGCCGGWTRHLQQSGFATQVHLVDDTSDARRVAGIPDRLASCHTARVGGYAIEGHVPAADIRRLLAERPKAVGLASPGMPAAAPGMDLASSEPYDVLLVGRDGRTMLFARHAPG